MKTRGTLKKRISPWTNPWLIAIGLGFLLLGVPMVLWLMTYHSSIAIQMFIITWVSLTVFVVMMAKRSLLDAPYYVDKKVLAQTRQEIDAGRIEQRRSILRKEIEVLERGTKTPVLDVWRLDRNLAKRHPYFPSVEEILLDPRERELQMRILIADFHAGSNESLLEEKVILRDLVSFLKIIVPDPYLLLLRKYFDRIVVQIDGLREDEHHVDRPYPLLSTVMGYEDLRALLATVPLEKERLVQLGDLRFEGGNEVEPHRPIGSDSTFV